MSVLSTKTYGDALDEVAAKYPDNEAIVFKGRRITYRQMQRQANLLAKGLLRLGIGRGDNVALWMGNRPEWIFLEYAVTKIGATLVTVNTRNRAPETEYILRQSESKLLVLPYCFLNIGYLDMLLELAPDLPDSKPGELHTAHLPNLKTVICADLERHAGTLSLEDVVQLGRQVSDGELARAQAAVQPDDVSLIVYTSGTTGEPKGAMLTHRSTLHHMAVVAERIEIVPADKWHFPLPLFHAGGCVLCVLACLNGACTICLEEIFEPEESLRTIHNERATLVNGSPTIFVMMLEHPSFSKYDTTCARAGVIGGASVPVDLVHAIISKMGVTKLCSSWGLTECSVCQTGTLPTDPPELIATTVGVPFPDNEVVVLNAISGAPLPDGQQGELCVRGHNQMKGYYKKPEETAKTIDKDGWLHTGDLGIRDPNGYFRITGRVKDMFIVGGSNAYPAEIEDFLYTHPKVKQVHVTGVPDHRLGEVCMAFIELKEGEQATAEEIIDFCKGKLANYKTPRYVKFMTEFPMTPSQKVQKFKLREMAIAELALAREAPIFAPKAE